MAYEEAYKVNNDHIDFQEIMDGLYYPFYMEKCRHNFVKSQFGISLEEMNTNGVNFLLIEYTMKFKGSLKKDDDFQVTCEASLAENNRPRIIFEQHIVLNGKIVTSGTFIATCLPVDGGRPFLPDYIKANI